MIISVKNQIKILILEGLLIKIVNEKSSNNFTNINLLISYYKINDSYLNQRNTLNHSDIVRNNKSNYVKIIENKIRENSQFIKNEIVISYSFLIKRKNNNLFYDIYLNIYIFE